MFYKSPITLLSFLCCIACSSGEKFENPVPFDVGDEVLQEKLIERLESERIDYEIINPTGIIVEESDGKIVLFHANQITNELIPFDRSISIIPPYRTQLIRLLDENDIQYDEIRAFNGIWIIWEESDAEMVEKLIERVMDP